ncbi:hypothetical protein RclHR1_14370003 [Rhizophagus clarus]|uniref:HAT C-terminal dimerisation domain-containing protein n=1 Tax=Rhizophagus clarus TaxID=94130 RepID=A0A2Z6QGU2_9GLOM|nr:hypothetical protein RclHR1_14370003 [Rhizophagus clarus]
MIEQSCELREIFLHAILHIFYERYPTIENSILIFNWLIDKIEDFNKEIGIDEIVKQAARNAIEKLKKYYQYTDGMIYTISTIFDPQLKLTYHRDHNWEEKYITEAQNDINDTIYTLRLDRNVQDEDFTADNDFFSHIYKKWRTSRNESELDLYLGSLVANEFQYSHLTAMACDYLAIPATNIPIKRAFSGSTDLISQKRCSLSSETIRAYICLKSW